MEDLGDDEPAVGFPVACLAGDGALFVKRRLREPVESHTWTRRDWTFVVRTFLFLVMAAVLLAAAYVRVVEYVCDDKCFPFRGSLGDDLRCECADLGSGDRR